VKGRSLTRASYGSQISYSIRCAEVVAGAKASRTQAERGGKENSHRKIAREGSTLSQLSAD
jgi:hypothetical protein